MTDQLKNPLTKLQIVKAIAKAPARRTPLEKAAIALMSLGVHPAR